MNKDKTGKTAEAIAELKNENEVFVIDPKEYGLEKKDALGLTKGLDQIRAEREILTAQYDEIMKMDLKDPKTAERAKETRLLIRDNRTKGVEVWHKVNKDFFLQGGRFVDATKNKEIAENQRMEANLLHIETAKQRAEAERVEKLNEKRSKQISKFVNLDDIDLNFGAMSPEVWEAYLTKKKKDFEDLKEAERQAEINRQIEARKKEEGSNRLKILIPLANYLPMHLATYDLVEMDEIVFAELMRSAEKAKIEADEKAEEDRKKAEKLQAEFDEKERRRKVLSGMFTNFDGICFSYNLKCKVNAEYAFGLEKPAFEQLVEKIAFDIEQEKKQEKELEELRLKRIVELTPVRNFLEVHFEKIVSLSEKDYQASLKKAISAKKEADAEAERQRKAKEEADRIIEAQRQQKLAEEKAEADRKAEAQRLAKAGDKERLGKWVADFNAPDLDSKGLNLESGKKVQEILERHMAFKKWALGEIEKI